MFLQTTQHLPLQTYVYLISCEQMDMLVNNQPRDSTMCTTSKGMYSGHITPICADPALQWLKSPMPLVPSRAKIEKKVQSVACSFAKS